MRTRLLSLASLPLLVVALGACGDGDEGGSKGTDTGTPASGLADVELTTDLGCGFGFARVDDAGETLLSIYSLAEAGEVGRTLTFPDSGWEATVNVGRHLDANWCSDVIMEPQSDVEESWEIVEGTLTFVGKLPSTDWKGNVHEATAELTGVVIENEDGEQVELDDVTLTNTSWGFLAG